uniref:EF-hand domain-containing protein n=1 Tax=Ditylum brightwellii TaxID=49249 RepID=A0A7S2EKX3_9STRA|mmetsp:Transcript_3442/g.5314  ORF Transcript_3442/g.5314 Transcript_3442/m.5314 type:complete len:636 (+) Transcript_3442:31-1938(+)
MNSNYSKSAKILACLCLPGAALGAICSGDNASSNWYGAVAYPPYFTRNAPEKCPQKYGLARCELSAVMKDGSSTFARSDDNAGGEEVCTPNVDCFPTKHNCNDTLVCSDLVNLKDELANGGYNIVCRHEKTYWQQQTGEVKNCLLNANCMDPQIKDTQRQLQPMGWNDADAFATAFQEMGIPVDKTFSSPFTRCAQHADLFSDESNNKRLELLYLGSWREVLAVNNITAISVENAFKWQAYNLRNFAGKKPMAGTNNVMVTHGFNMMRGFGTAVDEGYCMVLKPDDTQPSLAESIGNLTVANQVFQFDSDSFPVDAIARMSPQSALHMQTCDDVRVDLSGSQDKTDVLALYDSNHDMKITRDEFISAHGEGGNSADAFDFIHSVFIQADTLGKPSDDDEASAPSIELGRFFRLNWGWLEYLTSGGNIFYPWRVVLENTMGSGGLTSSERVAAFRKANFVLTNLIVALTDQDKYPSKSEMEKKLVRCESNDNSESQEHLTSCFEEVFHTSTTSSKESTATSGDTAESIFGYPLAYPSKWEPENGIYDSRSLEVVRCLVVQGSLTHSEISHAMGCNSALLSISSKEEVDQTAKILAWVFGALFICSLVALAYTLFGYLPKKLKSSKPEKNEFEDNEA